jgi:hypothetical protein
LEDLGSIENVIDFIIEKHDLDSLIEDIFINLDELNRLFQQGPGIDQPLTKVANTLSYR